MYASPRFRRLHNLDKYGSHKHLKVLRWLARHPLAIPLHPDLGLLAERRSRPSNSALTRRRLKRVSFHSVLDLEAAIHRYIAEHNDDPMPSPGPRPRRRFSPN